MPSFVRFVSNAHERILPTTLAATSARAEVAAVEAVGEARRILILTFRRFVAGHKADILRGVNSRIRLLLLALVMTTAQGAVPGRVDSPTVSTSSGFFFAPVGVVIRCATPGATIVYTFDGSEPSSGSGVKAPPADPGSPPAATIRITNTTTLRIAAVKDGFAPSVVEPHSYIFPARVPAQTRPEGASAAWLEDPPGDGKSYPAYFELGASIVNGARPGYAVTDALLAVPTLSLVTPLDGLFGARDGIYTHPMMRGSNWERRASVELIFPDGRKGFQVDAGLRVHGAVSRLNHVTPKHPLRLAFRAKYGAAKLDFPLFPDSNVRRFDRLVLRACSTDAWPMKNTVDFLWRNQDASYQRDQWMRDAQLAMGHPSPHGIYVQLYLNGLYWGLYNLTERPDESFAAAHFGGSRKEYDVVAEYNAELRAGNRAAWEELLALADRVPTDPAAFWQMQGLNLDGKRNHSYPVLLDVDNFIDYMALHIFAPAVDWPSRNWWAARRRGPESSGFKFFVWDQEVAIDRLDRSITWATNKRFAEVDERGTPAQIYDRLRRNDDFKRRFAERLQKHLFNGGALTIESCRARWAARAAEIDRAIVGESARWGYVYHQPPYTRESDWLRVSNFTQNVYWPANLTRALESFRSVDLFPK